MPGGRRRHRDRSRRVRRSPAWPCSTSRRVAFPFPCRAISTSPSWAGCTATRCPAGWPPGSASSPWWSRERATSTGSRAAGGPALLHHRRTSRVLQLDQRCLEEARRWFDRWGAWAIIFGRHIPGFRIVITVIAGTMGVPYRIFVPSVAVSTAIWAAVGMWLGATLGETLGNVLFNRSALYLLGLSLPVVALAVVVVRVWRRWGLRRAVSA
ncbi:MAG: hypothetical protein E6I10_00260 [Chloroflexi bacterium]|nr:MAG: hypothetical protein E6I10_00260 [Chloroflexota bacterium]